MIQELEQDNIENRLQINSNGHDIESKKIIVSFKFDENNLIKIE